jgi:DNA-binding LacI/PurR family transcriptional regulator
MGMRVSIKDVAREAGVSVSAVSRALSNGRVSAEKRSRVLEVVDRLGYRPSSIARGLVQGQSGTVTLVTGRMWDNFDASFLECLAEGLADSQRRLVVAPASRQTGTRGGIYQALDDQSEAVIIAAGTMPIEASRAAVSVGVPVILAGRILEEPGVDCIAADNAEGGRQAADLLLRSGCVAPAYFGFREPSAADEERGAAFLSACAAAGREARLIRQADRDDADLFEAASALLARSDRPDAIFCATDRLALGVIEAARSLGIAIPAQLSVVGFNNVPVSARHTYRLTTINYPVSRVVAEILDVLDTRLARPDAPSIRRRIPVGLIVRDTTRRIVA